jgi:acetylornithine deacetylase/succinyl-diaminopimelate desuccinylase-like protein
MLPAVVLKPTSALRDEAISLLRELIRIDTSNPPGNESEAAMLLRDHLEQDGIECRLVARDPMRANLVARLPGRGDGPSLAFLSHTDTVGADPAEWESDPWSGALRDDHIWGRGALDMKGQVAASAVAIASLGREGFEPAGDLIFVAAADEEVGYEVGLPWLCREHPELVRCDYAINEGGGERIVVGGKPFYVCSVAEKLTAPVRLRIRGRSGHASAPQIADNALVKAAPLIQRLGRFRAEAELIPEVEEFFLAVSGQVPLAEEALELARSLGPTVEELVAPLLGPTLAPTMIRASDRRNVIPALCELTVDCRLQPGQTGLDAERIVSELVGPGDFEVRVFESAGGTRSPTGTSLWRAIEEFLDEAEPGAQPAPICSSGFTDSHWLRQSFGTIAYGFFPQRTMEAEVSSRLVHGPDERIALDDLELGVRFLRQVAQKISEPSE